MRPLTSNCTSQVVDDSAIVEAQGIWKSISPGIDDCIMRSVIR